MKKKTDIRILDNPKEVAEVFAKSLVLLLKTDKRPFHIALSGGTTPKLLFNVLAEKYAKKVNWNGIHFWWGDERLVPPTDNESNFKMTQEHLLKHINIPAEQIHRVKGEMQPLKANSQYINEIKNSLPLENNLPVFDLVILGMGSDGHTASIFPNQLELILSEKICEIASHPETGQKRITLTGKVINNAKRVVFLVTGEQKKERVAEIINRHSEATKLPSFYIKPYNEQLTFYLDKAAAEGIK